MRTGITDLEYSEVVAGLAENDTILVLPSASLVQSEDAFRQRTQRMGALPGVQQPKEGGRAR